MSSEQVASSYSPVLALENMENAADIFAFKLSSSNRPALIIGNERFGISHDMVSTAEHVLHLPMTGPSLNTINVSAAAAVALYYLTAGVGARMPMRADPPRLRPEVLLIGGKDYIELGCSIRSSAAFGWERLFVEDRESVWFGRNRVLRSERLSESQRATGEAIRIVPVPQQTPQPYIFQKAFVINREMGRPLHDVSLAEGPQNLILIPDETNVTLLNEDWDKYSDDVEFIKIEVPQQKYSYHYHLFATIALAEISRQVGHRTPSRQPARIKQGRVCDPTLAKLLAQKGELVSIEDLSEF